MNTSCPKGTASGREVNLPSGHPNSSRCGGFKWDQAGERRAKLAVFVVRRPRLPTSEATRLRRLIVIAPGPSRRSLKFSLGTRATAFARLGPCILGALLRPGAEVSIDLRRFDAVEPFTRDAKNFVRVGAGCRLQDLLDRLHAATNQTLPTLGAIKRQTVAGAISTGTHGSGRQSLSHFVSRVRRSLRSGQRQAAHFRLRRR